VYGKVVSTHSEEFRARQAELRGGRERDVAVLELYDELSTHWRYLQVSTGHCNDRGGLGGDVSTLFTGHPPHRACLASVGFC
jgi:hypothetical protein